MEEKPNQALSTPPVEGMLAEENVEEDAPEEETEERCGVSTGSNQSHSIGKKDNIDEVFKIVEEKIDKDVALVDDASKAIMMLSGVCSLGQSDRGVEEGGKKNTFMQKNVHNEGNGNCAAGTVVAQGSGDCSKGATQYKGEVTHEGETNNIGKSTLHNDTMINRDKCDDSDSNCDVDTWSNVSYLSVDEDSLYNEVAEVYAPTPKREQGKCKREEMRRQMLKCDEEAERQAQQARQRGEPSPEQELPGQPPPVMESPPLTPLSEGTQDDFSKKLSLNAIDKSFIQIPLKCILNSFRNIQRELEKNFTIITLFIEKKLLNLTDEVYLNKLNTIIEKMESLRSKVLESKMLLNKYVNRLASRLKYIYFEGDIQLENLKHDFRFEMYENRINWLVDGYLSRYGFFDTVQIFSKRYKLKNYSDADVYKEYLDIISELKNYNIKPALEWCQKYKSQLKKIDSNVEAELHLQFVISVISENKFLEAIEYIKKTVSKPDEQISPDIKFLVTYIGLYGSNEKRHSTDALRRFNRRRWSKVIKSFQHVYSEITGVLNKPLLELLLKAGISVVKTEQCGKNKSTKCPTCINELKHTIKEVPHIQKTKSFFVCPYTSEVMDEKNPPFTTPAGHVFSEKAISLFVKSEDMFECPVTGEKYRMHDLSRLFI
ncbi:conserved Plasmodium protein, unknown function [Plasmodium knowlesi strain H]|uniref:CTLH domain-containing protein n=3 Tax=Plasmodium knowlesi TaxID=5850 RepID=A0A5K1V981_PLAKH|nr:CTLH domain-containing protein, putative [Plasmodium knowlesi strain H]OTN66513.1 Uncharacterized protein PKNOH_S09529000 [Plasmodium knowlesi]CAA9990017.1 CTLH domain-containing protein, putative [Plasmodium knowlesi strain H]SBO24619.1 conserved Plasmodium protein, unknown function [Plasmodium knowlesi strain H]SBO26213.1 conserved Plasmodium protein, unknown function [Plasmodium knowlesi strain H]VVS79491.1 CTLH domain-containing protein, putative [Plasmodium knowlesi strain H]|eukprot:XP_002260032.1 hypothetical protein, conserved in Plasmodium species [Plasmodium knowlesi strain H]